MLNECLASRLMSELLSSSQSYLKEVSTYFTLEATPPELLMCPASRFLIVQIRMQPV